MPRRDGEIKVLLGSWDESAMESAILCLVYCLEALHAHDASIT